MTDLEKFARDQLATAQKIIAEGGSAMPVLILDGPTPVIIGVPDFGNPKAKGACLAMMREAIKKTVAERYAFVHEAWFANVAKDDARLSQPGYAPRNDPQRIEGVVVSCASSTGEKLILVSEIKRGETVTFSDAIGQDGISHGPVLELFGTKETKH